MAFALLALFPSIGGLYETYRALKHVIETLIGLSGSILAYRELRHLDEANKHRAERNRLAQKTNTLGVEYNQDSRRTFSQYFRTIYDKFGLRYSFDVSRATAF
jgi:hypothetical protein